MSRQQHPRSDFGRSPLRVRGYLDELASDGEKALKAALARSSFSRLLCWVYGFRRDSFYVPQQSSTGDLPRARTEVPRVSYTGDNFAGMSSVLNKWLFRKMPNSRSCDEFSEAPPEGAPLLNAVYNATADV